MNKLDILKERTKQLSGERPIPYAIKLHLELDIDDMHLGEHEISLLAI